MESGYFWQRACPICSARKGRHLAKLNFAVFDDSPLTGPYDLVGCPDCGLAFYDGLLSPEAVENYYRGHAYYATAATAGAGGESPEDLQHQKTIVERLRLAPDLDQNQPVFDLGCGRGGLLKALIQAGHTSVYGVDLLPQSVATMQKQGLVAAVGSLTALPWPEIKPGLLIYSHVLEHVFDLQAVFQEARHRLAPGGLIYVEVPDATNYDPAQPLRELYLEHLNHFDPGALAQLLTNFNFEIIILERDRFPGKSGPGGAIIWALAKFRPQPQPLEMPPKGEALATLGHYLTTGFQSQALGRLKALSQSPHPWWIWGLSQQTMLLVGSADVAHQGRLLGFIDQDRFKQTKTVLGRPVQPPETLAGRGPHEGVLLAVSGSEEAMRTQLGTLDFQGQVVGLFE